MSVYVGAILLYAFAVSATLRVAAPLDRDSTALAAWAIARDATALLAAGAMVVSLCAAIAATQRARLFRTFGTSRAAPVGYLARVEDTALRLALPSLTLSLSIAAVRSWLGWGEVVRPGLVGFLIAWLLLVGALSGMVTGSASTRFVRVLTALSLTATLAGVLGFA